MRTTLYIVTLAFLANACGPAASVATRWYPEHGSFHLPDHRYAHAVSDRETSPTSEGDEAEPATPAQSGDAEQTPDSSGETTEAAPSDSEDGGEAEREDSDLDWQTADYPELSMGDRVLAGILIGLGYAVGGWLTGASLASNRRLEEQFGEMVVYTDEQKDSIDLSVLGEPEAVGLGIGAFVLGGLAGAALADDTIERDVLVLAFSGLALVEVGLLLGTVSMRAEGQQSDVGTMTRLSGMPYFLLQSLALVLALIFDDEDDTTPLENDTVQLTPTGLEVRF